MDIKKDLKNLTAFILVGGLGTRLKSIINDVPKPMAPILNKPFLYYKIMNLKKNSIKKIVFCSGYLHKSIEDYFGDGSKFNLDIKYSVEKSSLGTAGAIKNAEQFIDGPFLMMNGDTYLNLDVKEFYNKYLSLNAKYMMLLKHVEDNYECGIVITNSNNEIQDFIEKPSEDVIKKMNSPLLNAGVYLLSANILDYIKKDEKVSIEEDVFPILTKEDDFYSMIYDGYFIDIGIPKNYIKFQNYIKKNGGNDLV